MRAASRVHVLAIAAALALAGCVDRLPDQDRRIVAARPAAKLPVEDLVKEYAADAGAANRRYWGKAVEITGHVAATRREASASVVVFGPDAGAPLAEARLLDDQAEAILAAATRNHSLTLRCFCDRNGSALALKSCVAP